MKKFKKAIALVLTMVMMVSLTACGGGGDESSITSSEKTEPSAAGSSAVESKEDASSEKEQADTGTDEFSTPRNETLYLGGRQWGKPNNMNPLSPNPNVYGVSFQNDFADEILYETLYMFNLLTNEIYPLLADGDPVWNDDRTVMTVKINADAKWNDGTQVTAHDVVATYDTHVKYQSVKGMDAKRFIEGITAVDDLTVEIKAISDENYNPLKIEEYVACTFIMQKAYLEKLSAEVKEDPEEFKQATMWDAPTTGPYTLVLYDSEQKVVYQRDDNYWGQAESLWGKLPTPKYIVHNIYSGNDTMAVAFSAGEIDVNQQYMANLQDTWLKEGLPISTYLDDPPYQIAGGMPSLFLNQGVEVLTVKEVRQALAMAIDYDQIVDAAMTGQSPTFTDYPRSLFNPSDSEQAMIKDQGKLDEYRWANASVDEANVLLDTAGIVDADGDGIREYNGENITLKVQCPKGWSDWQAAVEIAVDAGNKIGLQVESYFPEAAQHVEDISTGNFEIAMHSVPASAGVASPWSRAYQFMYGYGGEFPETLLANFGRYYNEEADAIIKQIAAESDEDKLLDLWEQLNIIYLDDVPSIALMYRPALYHEVNETVWTNFPSETNNKGKDIPVPPQNCIGGYGIAGLYDLELVG